MAQIQEKKFESEATYNGEHKDAKPTSDLLQLSQLILVSNPTSLGIIPCILFWSKFKETRLVSNPISEGISPSNLFFDKSRRFSPVNNPISVGIEPVNLFESMTIHIWGICDFE